MGENGSAGMFGAGNAFGAATSSFPPAQPSSSSNAFSTNSFPAPSFGAANQSSAFQPPSAAGFDFSPASSANNPFGGLNGGAANTNGSAASTAFGGSVFGSQPASNPFGGAQNNASSASASTSLFGTANGASTPAFSFGASSSAAAPSTPAPASQPTFSFGGNSTTTLGANSTSTPAAASTPSFQFGATASAAPASTSTPAPTSSIFSFGGPAQNSAPAAAPAFGGFGAGADAQKSEGSQNTATPQKNMFGFGATGAQAADSTKAPAPATPSLFSFGAAATPKPAEAATTNMFAGASTPKPAETTSTNVFGGASTPKPAETTSTNMFASASTPAPAPASNLFSALQTSTSASTPKFSFGQTQESPKPQEPTPATPSFFNSVKPTDQAAATPEAPKDSLFAGLAKPASTPAPDFSSMFGASKDSAPKESEKPPMFQAPEAPKTNMFSGFSTPQPAKTTDNAQARAGMFTAQPKASSGFSFPSFGANSTQDASKAPESQPAFTPPAQQSPTKEASNPFASLPGASTGSSLFNPPKPSTEPTPTLDTAVAPQLPKIGKLSVPKDWAVQDITAPQNADGLVDYVVELSLQLQAMNLKYREMIGNASLVADWSLLSIWHHQQSRSIKTKIDNAKKQRAAAKGVTGNESTLSKRKGVEDGSDVQESSSKRSRPAEPSTPTPKSSTPASTPKVNPPATATSNLFSKAIGNKSSTPEKSAPSTGFTPSFSASAGPSAPKPTGFTSSFSASTGSSAPKDSNASGFTPSFGANGTDAAKPASTGFTPSVEAPKTSGFTPSFGAPKAAGGFTPSFGGSGNTDFTAQFAQKAKTYEQLAAERKKKAKDADYDSDDETEEEWSARYDKEEAERLAKEKEAIASAGGFSLPASTNASGSTTPTPTTEPAKEAPKPAANLFANLAKPTSGVSTPSLFTPRAASPAASTTGGRSVFDSPSAAPSPASNNLFGHLSSGPSSNNQDDSDDEDEHAQNDEAVGSTGSTSPKRKFGGSETESDDATSKKQATGTKGSLLSRMTRADDADSEAEKENDKPASIFGQTNGTSTPTNKPFAFFNFDNAGANTAPPKASTFAGDQTFKVGSPIKFGAPATEKKKDAPTFQFQPATPSPAEFSTTPAKPPPAGSLFSFGGSNGASLLAPNFGASAPSSVPSSVFSSRAGTPLSEAEPTTPSAAEDNDDSETHAQIDLSALTPEELASNTILFHTDLALAKQQVDHGSGSKKWENFARGPLWILKDKTTAKCFVRMRIPSGATPLNYQILPALRASVTGSSGKMVQATRPGKDRGLVPVYYAVRAREVAEELVRVYNESIPAS